MSRFGALAGVLVLCSTAAQAVLIVAAPWVRPTPERTATDAYMVLTSSEDAWLKDARSIVATSVGGLPSVIDEGLTGLLVPVDERAFGAALATLAGDHALAKAMGAKARDVALARYSHDRMVDAYLALYERALAFK